MIGYIVLAIVMFGILVGVHEFGHFLTAKLCGVQVNEFSIGMGPALWKKQKGETLYSMRLLPVGGYCAMEGEDEASQNPRAFGAQAAWKKVIILAAGAFMNFLTGFLIILILFAGSKGFQTTQIAGFLNGFPLEGEEYLLPGDRIVKINGERIYLRSDVDTFLALNQGDTVDLVIERNGAKLERNDLPLQKRTYVIDGQSLERYGITFTSEEATPWRVLRNAWYNSIDFVRLVRISLVQLFSRGASVRDLSGPIGIVGAMSEVGAQSQNFAAAVQNILYFVSLIAINLAVMNLLPLPALDGGRIFFVIVNGVACLLFRKRIPPKYEGYVHFAGLVCLLGLMVLVAFNDVLKLFGR